MTKKEILEKFYKKFMENKREDREDFILYLRNNAIRDFISEIIDEIFEKLPIHFDRTLKEDSDSDYMDGTINGWNKAMKEIENYKDEFLKI